MPQQFTRIAIGLAALVGALVAVLFGLILFQFFDLGHHRSPGENTVPSVPTDLVQAVRDGNFKAATSYNIAIQNDPRKSVEEKALATYSALGVQYRLTGDSNTRLIDIQNMKDVILDERVSRRTRVNTLNVLANEYLTSDEDPAVFAEMYKDAPFKEYLVPGDPDRSALQLAEWSYSMMPTSDAAIGIALWYTKQNVLNPKQPASEMKANVDRGVEYLNKADAASVQEAQQDMTYPNSTRYLSYRYWRIIVVKRLASQKGEPYQSQYQSAYKEFITYAKGVPNILANEYIAYARLYYASQLAGNGDTAGAKNQLDALAQEMSVAVSSDQKFARFLRDEHTNRPNGEQWSIVKKMYAISASFKAAVEKIIVPTSG